MFPMKYDTNTVKRLWLLFLAILKQCQHAPLLTWINLNPNMVKLSYAQ